MKLLCRMDVALMKDSLKQWAYDQYGRVTNKLDQAGATILKYQYDPNSRLTNRWSAAKGNTAYKYDALGNLTNIGYAVSPVVKLKYDALNRLTNLVDAVGTTAYAYTSGGLLYTEDGPFASDTVTNVYGNRLRIGLGLQQPTGLWTNAFNYDYAKRLVTVASPAGGFTNNYSSTRLRLVSTVNLPNGSTIANSYDGNARLLTTKLLTSTSSLLDLAAYGYNVGNQRTTYTNAAGTFVNYTYDPIGQLKIATISVGSENRGYQYDPAWNLKQLTNNGVMSSFLVDVKNELTNAAGSSQTYDANGNLTGSGGVGYAYDEENRLTNAVTSSSTRTTFVYDGLGRLREQLWWTTNNSIGGIGGGSSQTQLRGVATQNSGGGGGSGPVWILLNGIYYVYDGKRVIQERDVNNNPLTSYTRGNDLSGTLEGAGGIGGLLARSYNYSSGSFTAHGFYHADGNGNITYIEKTNQTSLANYRYDPFGNLLSSSGSLAATNTYRFSSKEWIPTINSYYYLYRFYNPATQRWLNRDPLGDFENVKLNYPKEVENILHARRMVPPFEAVDGANIFEFNKNNPNSKYDPFGLNCATDLLSCVAAGRAIAAACMDPKSIACVLSVSSAVAPCFAWAQCLVCSPSNPIPPLTPPPPGQGCSICPVNTVAYPYPPLLPKKAYQVN